jgi:hypothetical protein
VLGAAVAPLTGVAGAASPAPMAAVIPRQLRALAALAPGQRDEIAHALATLNGVPVARRRSTREHAATSRDQADLIPGGGEPGV